VFEKDEAVGLYSRTASPLPTRTIALVEPVDGSLNHQGVDAFFFFLSLSLPAFVFGNPWFRDMVFFVIYGDFLFIKS
jgi:hypothetical protein